MTQWLPRNRVPEVFKHVGGPAYPRRGHERRRPGSQDPHHRPWQGRRPPRRQPAEQELHRVGPEPDLRNGSHGCAGVRVRGANTRAACHRRDCSITQMPAPGHLGPVHRHFDREALQPSMHFALDHETQRSTSKHTTVYKRARHPTTPPTKRRQISGTVQRHLASLGRATISTAARPRSSPAPRSWTMSSHGPRPSGRPTSSHRTSDQDSHGRITEIPK